MKLLLQCILLLTIAMSQYAYGETKPYRQEAPKRVYYSPEKEKQIIDDAKKVCARITDYDISTLTPLIFSVPKSPLPHPVIGDRPLIAVKFMKDTTDYVDCRIFYRETNETLTLRKPNAIIGIWIFADTFQPAAIEAKNQESYIKIFAPDYTEFCKQNPDYKAPVKEYETPEWMKNIRSINEITKEELEAKGYKVTIGKAEY